jgi:hypothetical protein
LFEHCRIEEAPCWRNCAEGAEGTALKELSAGGKQWREQTEVENVLKETYNNKGKNVIE